MERFDEFQRQTTSPDNAVRFQEAFGHIDVRESLSKVSAPTIVFHAREDQRISIDQGRELTIAIPDAEFVPLESKNHILLGHEPAWSRCVKETVAFLAKHGNLGAVTCEDHAASNKARLIFATCMTMIS